MSGPDRDISEGVGTSMARYLSPRRILHGWRLPLVACPLLFIRYLADGARTRWPPPPSATWERAVA